MSRETPLTLSLSSDPPEIMELPIYQQDGSEAGRTATLDASIFDIVPNDHVIWLDVRREQAHKRQGTHKTKERSDVRGSTRKLYRQKGTGHARAGDAKSPIRKTGGRSHGPRPRQYRLNLNKKTKRLARRSALTYKAREDNLRVVEDFSLETPSTRSLRDLAHAFDLTGKVLLLTAAHEPLIYQSSKNLKRFRVKEGRNASTLDIMKADVILIQESALPALAEVLGAAEPAAAA